MKGVARATIPFLLLAAVSCSSNVDRSTAASTPESAPDSAPATVATTDTAGPTAMTAAPDPTDGPADADPTASGTEFCEAYQGLADATLADLSVIGPDVLGSVEALVESAPDEIRSDVATFADAVTRVADQQESAGDGFDAEEEVDALLSTPEFSGSFERVIGYVVSSCEISEPDPAGGDVPEIDPVALTQQLADDPTTAQWSDEIRIIVFGGRGVKLFTSLGADDAITLCETALDYVLDVVPDATVSLQSDASRDGDATEVIVEGGRDGCTAV